MVSFGWEYRTCTQWTLFCLEMHYPQSFVSMLPMSQSSFRDGGTGWIMSTCVWGFAVWTALLGVLCSSVVWLHPLKNSLSKHEIRESKLGSHEARRSKSHKNCKGIFPLSVWQSLGFRKCLWNTILIALWCGEPPTVGGTIPGCNPGP